MEKIFNLYIFITLCVISSVHSELQCYVCRDCASPGDKDLKACSSSPTITTPSGPGENSTASNSTAAIESSTVTSSTEAVISTNDTSNSATITDPSASTSSSATTSSSSTVTISTTVSPSPTTTKSTVTTKSTSNLNDITDSPIIHIHAFRKRRFIEDNLVGKKDCVCFNGNCDCADKLTGIRLGELRAPQFQCYKYVHKVNGTEVVDRGCEEVTEGTSACAVLNVTTGCTHCDTEKCNSAFSLQFKSANTLCLWAFAIIVLNIKL